jgi:serine/threonine protein kinase
MSHPVADLHGNGILHRDIKPENIVYSDKPAFSRARLASDSGMLSSLTNLVSGSSATINKLTQGLSGGTSTHTVATPAPEPATPDARSLSELAVPGDESGVDSGRSGRIERSASQESRDGGSTPRSRGLLGALTPRKSEAPEVVPKAKLLDFGVSQLCVNATAGADAEEMPRRGFDDSIIKATGTPAFYAPEMLVGKPFHGKPADVWASGVTLAFLVSGVMPFWSDNMPEVWRKIKEEPPNLPGEMSPSLRHMLQQMLAKTPDERPTVSSLRQHPWVTCDGAEPMPPQDHLPLEITDDDVRNAVKQMSNTFALVSTAKKWKAFARTNSQKAQATPPIEEGEVEVTVIGSRPAKLEKTPSTLARIMGRRTSENSATSEGSSTAGKKGTRASMKAAAAVMLFKKPSKAAAQDGGQDADGSFHKKGPSSSPNAKEGAPAQSKLRAKMKAASMFRSSPKPEADPAS